MPYLATRNIVDHKLRQIRIPPAQVSSKETTTNRIHVTEPTVRPSDPRSILINLGDAESIISLGAERKLVVRSGQAGSC